MVFNLLRGKQLLQGGRGGEECGECVGERVRGVSGQLNGGRARLQDDNVVKTHCNLYRECTM